MLSSLRYKKCIVTRGRLDSGWVEASASGSQFIVEVKVPEDETDALFALLAPDAVVCWLNVAGEKRRKIVVDGGIVDTTLDLSVLPLKHAHFVINNAGSHEPFWSATADIGFGEFDLGQHGREREVALACGCAMIIRRAALLGHSIFMSDFVAYFEDSELSRRLRRTGHTIVYTPGAIVYHKHSSTTTEHSPFWVKHIKRNRALYEYLGLPVQERHSYLHQEIMDLNHYQNWLGTLDKLTGEERSALEVLPSVIDEIKEVCARIDAGSHLVKVPSFGIFNRFWATKGGGEAHALFFATYLARLAVVDLISELDFDLDDLAVYFNVDARRLRKRIIGRLTTGITAEYDLFVNSAYQDETPSRAKHSFFIVSFPSRNPSLDFLRSYTFLANSEYTSRWIDRWWSHANPDVRLVEPIVSDALLPQSTTLTKSNTILSVGRFFTSGHSKNQLEIVRAFKAASLLVGRSSWRGASASKPTSAPSRQRPRARISNCIQTRALISLRLYTRRARSTCTLPAWADRPRRSRRISNISA